MAESTSIFCQPHPKLMVVSSLYALRSSAFSSGQYQEGEQGGEGHRVELLGVTGLQGGQGLWDKGAGGRVVQGDSQVHSLLSGSGN